jgi:hypothetical protein
MEFTIPIQNFNPQHMRVATPTTHGDKPLASISYHDGVNTFTSLTILLPPLPIKSYDSATGRLVLSLSGHASTTAKLQSIQDALIYATIHSQRTWFVTERAKETDEIRSGFQPFLDHNTIQLYCPMNTPSGTTSPNDVQIYSKGVWSRGVANSSLFQVGCPLRIAVKLQGISFHTQPVTGLWTGRFRLQHRILAILKA